MTHSLDGYVDVPTRLAAFYEKYPEGSVQMDPPTFTEILGKAFVWAQARAYRTPTDERPGVGTAWESIPGATPFTRGSELMNLETSCWGRAVAAVMPVDKIATTDEIALAEARRGPDERTPARTTPRGDNGTLITEPQLKKLRYEMRRANVTEPILNDFTTERLKFEIPAEGLEALTKHQASDLIDALASSAPIVHRTTTPDPDDPWQK